MSKQTIENRAPPPPVENRIPPKPVSQSSAGWAPVQNLSDVPFLALLLDSDTPKVRR